MGKETDTQPLATVNGHIILAGSLSREIADGTIGSRSRGRTGWAQKYCIPSFGAAIAVA